MSWIDRIENELIITTGDSKRYTPTWINASYDKEYNLTQFDFPGLKGTLVKRNEPMGRKLTLELHFSGPDHLDTADDFSTSADDKRPWKLEHPYYGLLYVQPLSINMDNTKHNVSKVTVPVMETILEDSPKVELAPIETIALLKTKLDAAFAEITAEVKPADVTAMQLKAKKNFKIAIPQIKIPAQVAKFVDLFNKANAAVNKATQLATTAMSATIALISYPAQLEQSIKSRVDMMKNQFETLRSDVENIVGVGGRQIYQGSGGSLISSLALAASTPFEGDYKNNTEILDIMDTILNSYNRYMADLDLLQGDNGGNPESFIPDPDSIIMLNNIVNLTISSLFSIALAAKKERSIITEQDTNIVILTHRLYGLDPLDKNIEELMNNNHIGVNQLLVIKKGTKIIYYI